MYLYAARCGGEGRMTRPVKNTYRLGGNLTQDHLLFADIFSMTKLLV